MQASTKPFLFLAVLLFISIGLYSSRSQTLVTTTEQTVAFTNPYALKDWVPGVVYDAALQHIEYYLATGSVQGKLLTLADTPRYGSDGSLSFEFTTDQDASTHTVTIETTNYGDDITSSAVSIDGDLVTYALASHIYDVSFNGFDGLLDSGLSGVQVYEIQKQLARFAGPSVDINLGSTLTRQVATDGTRISCPVLIKGRQYQLTATFSDITSVRFILTREGKQVFDSGLTTLTAANRNN